MEKLGLEVAAPSDLQPATINWAALAKQAVDLPGDMDVQDVPAPPVEKVSNEPALPTISEVAAKAQATPEPPKEVEAAPDEAPEPSPDPQRVVRKFEDDDLVEIKVDGKVEVVKYKDYKDGIQREAHYTRRMQQLAAQRQAAEQELVNQYATLWQQAQQLEAERRTLQENNPLARLAKQLEAQEKVEQDPNTLATVGEIRKALDDYKQQLASELNSRDAEQQAKLAQAAQALRQQQMQAADAARFTNALNETLSNKDLAVIKTSVPRPELVDAIIRYEVAQMGPESIDEGIEMMQTYVKAWADNVRSQQKVAGGRAEAQKARAVIEPPQGSPPAPIAPPKPQDFFKKDGSGLDWAALHQKALAVMEG